MNKILPSFIAILFFTLAVFTLKEMPWTCVQEQEVKIVKVEHIFSKTTNSRQSIREQKLVQDSSGQTKITYEVNGKLSDYPVILNNYSEFKEGSSQKFAIPSSCSDGYFPWKQNGYISSGIGILLGIVILASVFI